MLRDRLSPGERLILGFGVLLLADSLLPWFRSCVELLGAVTCSSRTGWELPFSGLAMLIALAMVAQVLSRLGSVALPQPGPLTWGRAHLIAGLLVLGLILLQLVVGATGRVEGAPLRLDRTVGVIVGPLLAIGLAAAARRRVAEPETQAARAPARPVPPGWGPPPPGRPPPADPRRPAAPSPGWAPPGAPPRPPQPSGWGPPPARPWGSQPARPPAAPPARPAEPPDEQD